MPGSRAERSRIALGVRQSPSTPSTREQKDGSGGYYSLNANYRATHERNIERRFARNFAVKIEECPRSESTTKPGTFRGAPAAAAVRAGDVPSGGPARKYAPPEWNCERDDSPDVVFVARTGEAAEEAGGADATRGRREDKSLSLAPKRSVSHDDYDAATVFR